MSDRKKRIRTLENENAEIAKEILLNESAIYEAEQEIANIETELLGENKMQHQIQLLKLMVD